MDDSVIICDEVIESYNEDADVELSLMMKQILI